jgi:hypothetical protein
MISTTKWLAAVGCAAIAATGACKKRERVPAEEPIVASSAREDTAREEAAEQSAEEADRWLEQRVEQGLVDVPGLSAMTRGVEVEVEGGVVTIRGPVTSGHERAIVEAIAIANAGAGNVRDQLMLDPSGRGWAAGGGPGPAPQPQEPAPPEQVAVESAPPPPAPAPMPEYGPGNQGPTPTPPMAQPGPMGITTPGTVDTGGVPATGWDAAPPDFYANYGVPLVLPVPDVVPTTPLSNVTTNPQPGLTVPGEAVVIPGTTGITQGTTAPASSGISPGTVRATPTVPGPIGTTQPGVVTQPTPTPFNSTISPTNPGMNTPTTVNPAPMGPGTGNTGVAPALTPPPPSRPVVVRPLNR